MTVIGVYRRGGVPIGLRVYGHSGCAESGADVVCAAVSVLVQTLHIGLADVLGQKPEREIDEENASIELRWDDADVESVRVLSETIVRALYETAQSYGSYVKYVEVSL
ncbi:ribosomal-processing cysteine protease Prp [Pyramidobacter sp. CG50-2]|uniref:ribosomal-processing cysteine protease Prp n=1 Tax=Pyramidobacter sp. CG50-2 TaxID=2382160 RepID=UPI000EA3B5B8|nr:ribosomal-processing cysteine protease Prp [Pyramidobacter sp. CG50-2]RKJ75964.1 ribosomal-processing cysteine protease Prp [Pyramidobacter sp. CG50-2]